MKRRYASERVVDVSQFDQSKIILVSAKLIPRVIHSAGSRHRMHAAIAPPRV